MICTWLFAHFRAQILDSVESLLYFAISLCFSKLCFFSSKLELSTVTIMVSSYMHGVPVYFIKHVLMDYLMKIILNLISGYFFPTLKS